MRANTTTATTATVSRLERLSGTSMTCNTVPSGSTATDCLTGALATARATTSLTVSKNSCAKEHER